METLSPISAGHKTEDIVISMLTENTGSHFLDSGGAYGRNWSRNQGRDFASEPKTSVEWNLHKDCNTGVGNIWMCASVSLYHWMVDNLRFDPEMQAKLDAFAEENPDSNWLALQEEFADAEFAKGGWEKAPYVVNTYNDPDNVDLSQVLQYVVVYTDDSYEPSHLIVSVHGGCDVRGGYSASKCFELRSEYYEALNNAKVRILSAGEHYWDIVNGCSGMDAPVEDVLKLPAYEPEDLEDEAVGEFQDSILRSAQHKKSLKDTTLTGEQRVAAEELMDATVTELEGLIFDRCVEVLVERHEHSLLLHNKCLFLVYIDPDGDAMADEITAYNE